VRDPIERADELYLRCHLLQERVRALEMEKDRLDSVVMCNVYATCNVYVKRMCVSSLLSLT